MSKFFYELEQAARVLGVSVEEIEEMISAEELPLVSVGTTRRLVRIQDVNAVLKRVESGGRLRTRREFRAPTVEDAVIRASVTLGVVPNGFVYKVLERGGMRGPNRSKEARIVVDLTALPESADRRGSEATAGLAKKQYPEPWRTFRPQKPTRDGGIRARMDEAYYYAPGQVAQLLNKDAHEIDLWIYLKKLPVVNINDYRWIPKKVVDDLLSELSPRKLEKPPKPFLILTPPGQEAESAEDSRLGTREITPEPQVLDLLKQKIAELEEKVRILRDELRLEKTRRVQDLEKEQAQRAKNDPKTRRETEQQPDDEPEDLDGGDETQNEPSLSP